MLLDVFAMVLYFTNTGVRKVVVNRNAIRYSPDLNPLDFFLWSDIRRRMTKCDPKNKKESVQEYKKRLRKVAMSTSKVLIHKALANMKKRIAAVYAEKGQHIKID